MKARINSHPAVADRRGRGLIRAGLAALVALAAACSTSSSGSVKPAADNDRARVVTGVEVAPGADEQPEAEPAPTGPLRVEVWGDSLIHQAADYLRFFFVAGGKVTVTVHAFGGTAICDWLPDMQKELDPTAPAAFHPQAAVLAFNGDSGTPCMSDPAGNQLLGQTLINKYLEDSAKAIELFTRAGVPIYFVTDPLDSVTNFVYINFTQIGQLFSQLPKLHPAGGLVRWIDAATPLEDNGRFTYTLPCQPWETCTGVAPDGTRTVTVRQADGMHFCPTTEFMEIDGSWYCPVPMPGATRYAMAISGPVLRDFGLAGSGR